MGTCARVARVDFSPRIAAVRRRPLTKSKMYYRKKKYLAKKVVLYDTEYMCLLTCGPEKKKKGQKPMPGRRCTESDGQTLRSFFLRDNHHLLLA